MLSTSAYLIPSHHRGIHAKRGLQERQQVSTCRRYPGYNEQCAHAFLLGEQFFVVMYTAPRYFGRNRVLKIPDIGPGWQVRVDFQIYRNSVVTVWGPYSLKHKIIRLDDQWKAEKCYATD